MHMVTLNFLKLITYEFLDIMLDMQEVTGSIPVSPGMSF